MSGSSRSTVYDPQTGGTRVINNDEEGFDQATNKWWKKPTATNPEWNPESPYFAGKVGYKRGDGNPLTKDDVYQLKSGQWLPLFGNDDAKNAISADKLERENDAKTLAAANERLVSAQNAMALSTVARARPKPKGGTILTSPLGVPSGLGSVGGSSGKTLIGA